MESEVECAKFFVDALVKDPIKVKPDKLVAVGVGNRHTVSVFHQWHRHNFIVFTKRYLQIEKNNYRKLKLPSLCIAIPGR